MSDTDPVFVPNLFGRTGITPTVGLGIPLYVIRATFVHPVTGADTQLPPHHWVLFDQAGGTIVSASQQSDARGICVVNDISDPGNGALVLGLVPAPADVRQFYLDNDEAWIDLDRSDWAAPQPDRAQIERRNLYRIPAWTTLRKARRGGGFKEWPDKASPESKQRGVLDRADVLRKRFGAPATPWQIPLDFGWIRTTVRFSYVDWVLDKHDVLPPGLIVDAVPSLVGGGGITRLGAGTAVKNGDGSIRMMIEAEPTHWPGMQLQFKAPALIRVDLKAPAPAAGAKDTRLVAGGTLPADRNDFNRLPEAWHTLGQRCKVAVVAPSARTIARDSWINIIVQLRNDNATDLTVDFHLDDVQLCNGDSTPRSNVNGRPALFDHFMTLLDPVATRPHQSDTTVDQSVVRADKVYTVGRPLPAGRKRLEASTRLIYIDGDCFDLRDGRVTGTIGRTPGIGARGAFHNFHPNKSLKDGNPFLGGEGFYEIHIIDVPGVQDPVARKQLMHMLLLVSCKVDPGGLPAAQVDQFFRMLTEASERWSQGSPGVNLLSKNYQIVTRDPANRDHVIRPRAYFGEKRSSAILDITLKKGGARSSTQPSFWFVFGRNMEYFDGAIALDVARNGGSGSGSDGITAAWHTLAHEFGHVFGLPDEYAEELDPTSVDPAASTNNPRVPGYDQQKEGMPTDHRPYYGDRFAQMNQNALPRLRHFWHHVKVLNADANFGAGLPKRPYLLRHDSMAIEFVRPVDPEVHPYTAVFVDKPLPVGHAKCALFPLGNDEGTVEAMFAVPGAPLVPLPAAGRFDAIVVVRPRVRFRFDSTVAKVARWQIIFDKFYQRLYDSNHRPNVGFRFALVGGTKLTRIAIAIQPLCAEGIGIESDDFKMLFTNKIPIAPNPFDGKVSSSVDLDIAHFHVNTALRAILGVPTAASPASGPGAPVVANKGPLLPADFVNVVKLVDTELGDATLIPRTVVPI